MLLWPPLIAMRVAGWLEPRRYLQFWHLLVEALIFGVVDSFFGPAILAITPDLVEKEHLASANALNSLSGNMAQLFGPALGALLIALFSPMGAFFCQRIKLLYLGGLSALRAHP